MNVVALEHPQDIGIIFPKVDKYLQSFAESDTFTVQDFVDDIKSGSRQMWYVEDGADIVACALTSIAKDRKKSCLVTHCAGEGYTSWVQAWYVIESWAKDIGCKRIEATTRPGWERPLTKFGLRKSHVVLEKEL